MRKYLFSYLIVGLIGAPVSGQEIVLADPLRDSAITVLASGLSDPLSQSGQPIAVFDLEQIEAVQGPDLTRLLERSPGVALSRNGGLGAFTSLRLRGAEGEQLLVLVDGVRVADPAAPGAGYDLGNLLMGNFAKVELLRSSNSTIWGSQAIGGVLAVTTGGHPGIEASAEYGAYETFYGTAGAAFEKGPAAFSVHFGHADSDGFSAAAAGTEPDGFRQTEVSGRGELALGGGLSAFASARRADGRLEIDGYPAPDYLLADTEEYQDTRQFSAAGGLAYSGSALELRAAYSLADTERDSFDPTIGDAPSYRTDGHSQRAELRGRWGFAPSLALDFGGEREWTRFSTTYDAERSTAITGLYAQLGYDTGAVHLAAGLRRDDHRDFGAAWSPGADAAIRIAPGVRLTAAYGEGFKAPSLYQLLSDYGNAALTPERSRSYDAGVAFDRGGATMSLAAFRRDTSDLIAFVSCYGAAGGLCEDRPYGTYDNIGRARAQGLEAQGKLPLPGGFALGANYTWLKAENRTPGDANYGNRLPRRPDHAATLMLDWRRNALTLGTDWRLVSASYEDAANGIRLAGYDALTLRGQWQASEAVALFARLENAFDETYQTAAGYGTAGRGLHVGARAAF